MGDLNKGDNTLMETRAILCDRNRRIVQDGLARRQEARRQAQVEADCEAFENDMFNRLNSNYANAVWQDICGGLLAETQQECRGRINKRAESRTERQERRKDNALGCLVYFAFAVFMFWLTTWTFFPIWGALTFTAGASMILAAYLYRVNVECREEGHRYEQYR